MESESFFDARSCYEDGVGLCAADGAFAALRPEFMQKIDTANIRLAERNIQEAESAAARGDVKKATDHLELVKTLTYDAVLREKAEEMLQGLVLPDEEDHNQSRASSCASCSGSSHEESSDGASADDSLPLPEYYELLIQQLPADQYQRYVGLGEDFAYAYVAASRDHHREALAGLEKCAASLPHDIYRFEKGKILHRLGNDREAEEHLRAAVQLNGGHSLARLTLAMVLRENGRLDDAVAIAEAMIAEQAMAEPALLLRADICEAAGDHEGAVNRYVELLHTPYARVAAEKLYVVLLEIGRASDAEAIFKKYLKKSCH
jgi:tetratricopeptide (TPR) repeat protein